MKVSSVADRLIGDDQAQAGRHAANASIGKRAAQWPQENLNEFMGLTFDKNRSKSMYRGCLTLGRSARMRPREPGADKSATPCRGVDHALAAALPAQPCPTNAVVPLAIGLSPGLRLLSH